MCVFKNILDAVKLYLFKQNIAMSLNYTGFAVEI
jgi:hypothetical protein